MYTNSGYMNNSLADFDDKSQPLIIGSCGEYRSISYPKHSIYRPNGRVDYQIIYIASGRAHFFFEKDNEEIVSAGQMVLYRPNEMQKYDYYATDHIEVYWIHFTGSEVEQILEKYGLSGSGHVFDAGPLPDYRGIFRKMIRELQLCKPNYSELLSMLFRQFFILVNRHSCDTSTTNHYIQNEMEQATRYFNENYNKEICIDEYAASRNMSTCWFIRNFKQYNNVTPKNYILSVRISNAQYLLENTSCTIAEIASIIGYDNAHYFSRLFMKQVGLTPTEYRNQNKPT